MLWLIGVIFLLVVSYLVWVWADSLHSIKMTPKIDMYICPVHGPMPKSVLMKLFPDPMDYVAESQQKHGIVWYCPICFETRIGEAKDKYGKDR